MDPQQNPDPQEAADALKDLHTRADLEKMLQAIEELKGGKEVLDPSGKPIEKSSEKLQQMQNKVNEFRRRKSHELAGRLMELSESNEKVASCYSLLREAHCLIFLALSELSAVEGMDDELLAYVEGFFRESVRQDTSDELADLIKRIKRQVLPFLNKLKIGMETRLKKRKEAIKRLAQLSNGHPHIKLECLKDIGVMAEAMPMGMGRVMLYGDYEPTQALSEVCSRLAKKGYALLCLDEAGGSLSDLALSSRHVATLPEKWWNGCASTAQRVEETLSPALENHHLTNIVVCSSLLKMLPPEAQGSPEPIHRQRAMMNLSRWAMDNFVGLIVLDSGELKDGVWGVPAYVLKKEKE